MVPMKRLACLFILLIAVAVTWRFPLVRVHRLDQTESEQRNASFDAAKFAETFWNEQLVKSLETSADAAEVVTAVRQDPREAGQRFGRSIGISRARLLCVRGSGTIVSFDKQGVGVALMGGANGSPDVVLQTGLLFGNTVRDASGLLDASEFSSSQHYNDISSELNRIVEMRVISELKKRSQVGKPITFCACGQLKPDSSEVLPLRLIALKVEFE
jgi:predicted lipoprotein